MPSVLRVTLFGLDGGEKPPLASGVSTVVLVTRTAGLTWRESSSSRRTTCSPPFASGLEIVRVTFCSPPECAGLFLLFLNQSSAAIGVAHRYVRCANRRVVDADKLFLCVGYGI